MKKPTAIHVDVEICGDRGCTTVKDALVDTGASHTFVSARAFRKAGIHQTGRDSAVIADGRKMDYDVGRGKVCVPVASADGKSAARRCVDAVIGVTPDKNGVVLGFDALMGLETRIDLGGGMPVISAPRRRG